MKNLVAASFDSLTGVTALTSSNVTMGRLGLRSTAVIQKSLKDGFRCIVTLVRFS